MTISADNTSYTIQQRDDGTFAVQIISLKALPATVTGFQNAVEAEEWIANAINHVTDAKSTVVAGQTSVM